MVAKQPFTSVALIENVLLCTTVGVPLTTPVEEFNVRPVGSEPTTLHV